MNCFVLFCFFVGGSFVFCFFFVCLFVLFLWGVVYFGKLFVSQGRRKRKTTTREEEKERIRFFIHLLSCLCLCSSLMKATKPAKQIAIRWKKTQRDGSWQGLPDGLSVFTRVTASVQDIFSICYLMWSSPFKKGEKTKDRTCVLKSSLLFPSFHLLLFHFFFFVIRIEKKN